MTNPPAIVRSASELKAALKAAFDLFQGYDRKRLEQAIVIGGILAEQKRQCGHGNWLPWLAQNFAYGSERAADFIRVYMQRDKCGHLAGFEEALQFLTASARADSVPSSDVLDPADPPPYCGDAWEPPGEPERVRAPGSTASAHDTAQSRKHREVLNFDPTASAQVDALRVLAECQNRAAALKRQVDRLIESPMADDLRELAKAHGIALENKKVERMPIGAPQSRAETVLEEHWPALTKITAVLSALAEAVGE